MTKVSLTEFCKNPKERILDIVSTGDVVCVRTGTINAVIMEEREYKMMREALQSVLTAK